MLPMSSTTIRRLTQIFGDSFYILDSNAFRENCCNLLNSFRKYYEKTNLAYSYKTNYIPKLGRIVNEIGGCAEVVSEMELELATRIGVNIDRIVWNGPVKNRMKMESFLLAGGTVNIDSIKEFDDVCEIARQNKTKTINVGIRCNYDIGDGIISRFGFDVNGEEIDRVLNGIASIDNIELKALQSHFAKRHYKYWRSRAQGLLSVYEKAVSDYGLKPLYLDLGGGLSGEMPESLRSQMCLDEFSFDDYAMRAAMTLSDYFFNESDKPWLFIEPGTAVVADTMKYVCKVETIKTVRGKTIITTNGSQKNIGMNGLNPPLAVMRMGQKGQLCEDADIAGYTCIESDYLYKSFNGEVAVGDYLLLGSCGSYSIVMKPPFILPNVPIVDVSEKSFEVIKRAESFNDIFCSYNLN